MFNRINTCIRGDNHHAKLRAKQVVDTITRGDGMALLKALRDEYLGSSSYSESTAILLHGQYANLKMESTGNYVRGFFTKVSKLEKEIISHGGTVLERDRLCIILNGFKNNSAWSERVENIHGNLRVNGNTVNAAKLKAELLLRAKPFESDAPDTTKSTPLPAAPTPAAVTLSTRSDPSTGTTRTRCGACWYRTHS